MTESLWRAVDRLASVTTVAAFAMFIVGAVVIVVDNRATAADPVAVDEESVNDGITATLGATVAGHSTAALAIIEFSDFECPFCARYAGGTHARIEREYVDTGKVQYAFRHMPLPQLHPHAIKAAEAAECAGRQQRFWDMYDRLFAHQTSLAPADLAGHAAAIGLDRRRFASCLQGEAADVVSADRNEAARLGITSTPTFLIGRITTPGHMTVLRRVKGAYPPSVFAAILDELHEGARR